MCEERVNSGENVTKEEKEINDWYGDVTDEEEDNIEIDANDVHSKDSINWTDKDIRDVIEFETDEDVVFQREDTITFEDDDDGLSDYESYDDEVPTKDNSDDEKNKIDTMTRELRENKFKISDGVQIVIQPEQVFNSINEFMSVLNDFIIQNGA